MNSISIVMLIFLLSILPSTTVQADELTVLLDRVEALNISRNNFTLGKRLTNKQKKAHQYAIETANPVTYKFKDRDLYVVVDRKTDRVIILYEYYELNSKKKVQELVGSLLFDFGDPTVMAHDKIIYWVFDQKGKLSENNYHKAKDSKEQLSVLATVKLNSSLEITGRQGDTGGGNVYYIISSEPVLKLIQSQGR